MTTENKPETFRGWVTVIWINKVNKKQSMCILNVLRDLSHYDIHPALLNRMSSVELLHATDGWGIFNEIDSMCFEYMIHTQYLFASDEGT